MDMNFQIYPPYLLLKSVNFWHLFKKLKGERSGGDRIRYRVLDGLEKKLLF